MVPGSTAFAVGTIIEHTFDYAQGMAETCTSTHLSPTATGDVEVRCQKPAGHVEAGDPQHEGKVSVFPVRWTD
jgi:hypothetical protein